MIRFIKASKYIICVGLFSYIVSSCDNFFNTAPHDAITPATFWKTEQDADAAHAIGLGSCWIHREREMFSTPEGKELMKSWGLPEGLVGIGALALGYPAEEPAQPKPRKQDYYRVIK